MMVTAITYVIIQIPGLIYMHSSPESQASGVKAYAFVALLLCTVFFIAYLNYQFSLSGSNEVEEKMREDVMIDAIIKVHVICCIYLLSNCISF